MPEFRHDDVFCATADVHDDAMSIRLVGDFDMVSAPLLRDLFESIDRGDVATVRFDLSDLRFIDSSGVRALVEATMKLRTEIPTVAIEPTMRPMIAEVLTLSGTYGQLVLDG